MTSAHLRTVALAPLAALALPACGSESSGSAAPPASGAATTASDTREQQRSAPRLPDVRVKDLAGGEVTVSALAPSERPLLVWFWAPHCPSCNAEAPEVESFSRRVRSELTVVGLGAQDSEEMAQDFVREHELKTPRMLYDASFESWAHFGINGQPAAILFDRKGVAQAGWFGPFPEDEVMQRVRAMS